MANTAYGEGESRAKFILLGEHSVVYGKPAIAVPLLNLAITARAQFSEGPLWLDSDYYSGPLDVAPQKLEPIKVAVLNSLKTLGAPLEGVTISLESGFPIERGLGSSAAITGAIAHAIADLYQSSFDNETHYEIVQSAERLAHGNPSGLDARTTNSTKPLLFKNGVAQAIELRLSGTFIIADSGIRGTTLKAVSDVKALFEKNPGRISQILDRLEKLVELGLVSLTEDQPQELGSYMNEAQQLLGELTVSHPALDSLIAVALNHGAYGAKLTGGGQGGCIVALAENTEAAEQISEALLAAGARETWLCETRALSL